MDRTGAIIQRRRTATPRDNYRAIVATIASEVAAIENVCADIAPPGSASVGVGIPGTISPATRLIKNANTVVLIGNPLDKDLGEALGRPVRLANDANCFALSEASDGAGAGFGVVFGVILGTGTGGGTVVNGKILTGPNAIAGEWGHNPLPWASPARGEFPGPACYCGKHGCTETFLSGPGLEREHLTITGQQATATDIAQSAKAGDQTAMQIMEQYYDRMARALATVINLTDPDIIVLGGGLSKIDALYVEVPKLLPLYVFSDTVTTPIVRPMHGDSSGVRGAAWLWP